MTRIMNNDFGPKSADTPSTPQPRSSDGKRGLDPAWYLRPDCFDFEFQQLFQKSWQLVGYDSQVPSIGEYFRVQLGGVECFVIRDKKNEIRLFQNVCRHRGTQLCIESSGKHQSSVTCPYHGWKYDLDGRLIAAPYMQNVPGFCTDEFGLMEFPVVNWNGFLFSKPTTIDSMRRNSDPDEYPLPTSRLNTIADTYELSQFQFHQSLSYDIAANWKLVFQNFNECYHCPSVHPQLTPLTDFRDSENEFDAGAVLGGPMKIREGADSVTNNGKFCGSLPPTFPETELRKSRYFTLFPNLFLSFFPDYVMAHRILPKSHNRTQIECDFLFHHASVKSPQFDPQNASAFWDLTNRQDWEMCERVQCGMATPGFQTSPYSNLESLLVSFDDHYVSTMQELGYCLDED